MTGSLAIRPLTLDRWPDLVRLFGDRGASSGCWCMWFRARPRDWSANGNAGNRAELEALVRSGQPTGLLAHRSGDPVGWVSVAPRSQHVRIAGPDAVDDGTWSITCFYIDAQHRGEGIGAALLAAAADHAFDAGATAVEGYPVEPDGRIANASGFTGLRAMFEAAGFGETGRFDRWAAVPAASGPDAIPVRRSAGRPVLRRERSQPEVTALG